MKLLPTYVQNGISLSLSLWAPHYICATDCGFFKFSNTTANTPLEMAAKCVAAGAGANVISETIEAVSVSRLELTNKLCKLSRFHKNNTHWLHNRVWIMKHDNS